MRTILTHRSKGIVCTGLSCRKVTNFNFGIFFQPLVIQPHTYLFGNFRTCSDGHFNCHAYTPIILSRHELGSHETYQEYTEEEERHTRNNNYGTVSHSPMQQTSIGVIKAVQPLFDRSIQQFEKFRLLGLQFQHAGTEHRSQRQSAYNRDNHNNCHHPTQLFEKDPGHTGYHRQREEHGDKRQRGCYHRKSHFIGSMYGGLPWLASPFNVIRHVFEHHNGIIDYHTDGDRKRRKRDDVQRVSRSRQINKRSDQRNRDCNNDNQCSSPSS